MTTAFTTETAKTAKNTVTELLEGLPKGKLGDTLQTIADLLGFTVQELKVKVKELGFVGNSTHKSKWQANANIILQMIDDATVQAVEIVETAIAKTVVGVKRSCFAGFGQYVTRSAHARKHRKTFRF